VRQQRILFQSDRRSIPDRIVSLCQPHIRPIVRGKAWSNVEFGAKISISVTGDGFSCFDRLSFSPYNEGEDLKAQTRAHRVFCRRQGIRLSGPRLGPPKVILCWRQTQGDHFRRSALTKRRGKQDRPGQA
jgi:hypothetical protein